MRRKDKERDEKFGLEVIKNSEYTNLAMIDKQGSPYVVTLSHALIKDSIYFHSAKSGEKCENIKLNSKVCASFVCDVLTDQDDYTVKYKSAIVKGDCFLVTDENEKEEALREIVKKYIDNKYLDKLDTMMQHKKNCSVYKIIPNNITAKTN